MTDVREEYAFDFGLRLKELRKKAGLSQPQVAKKLEVERSTVSGYERNISWPTVPGLIKLASIYNVSIDYMLNITPYKTMRVDGISEEQVEILERIYLEFKKTHRC